MQTRLEDVNAPGVRRVVERLVLDVRAIVEHRAQSFGNALQQIVAHDHERDAARSHVLLRAGVDQAVLIDRNRVRKNVGRSIGNQRHIADFRFAFPFNAFDRFVGRDVNVGGAADSNSARPATARA